MYTQMDVSAFPRNEPDDGSIIDTITFLLRFTIIYECLHVPDIVQGIKSGIR